GGAWVWLDTSCREILRCAQEDGNRNNLKGVFIIVVFVIILVVVVLVLIFLFFVFVLVVVIHPHRVHAALSFLTIGRTFSADTICVISFVMKRAVIGVPSKCRTEIRLAGLMPASLTSSVFSCASRFCSTTNTFECEATKSKISSWNGNERMRSAFT